MDTPRYGTTSCRRCGAVNLPGSRFCQNCGADIRSESQGGWAGAPPQYRTEPPDSKEHDQTMTGLLLMAIGFGLGWIPYVADLGGFMVLIGLIFVFLGRDAFGAVHHRNVVVGGLLVVLTLIAGIVLAAWFAYVIFGLQTNAGTDLSGISAQLTGDFEVLFVGAAVLGVISVLASVILVYDLAGETTRLLLWMGFLLATVISVATVAYLLPQIQQTISQATSGTTLSLGPVQQLETTSLVLGLAKIAPDLMFTWAYLRARNESMDRQAPLLSG
ncbi:MAG TPA: zinc ribbon domain-containing protein [Thermoplasmata archaeon]|nr:zinc ribbon domain-containing protein [Thermoplasmata archaeon]